MKTQLKVMMIVMGLALWGCSGGADIGSLPSGKGTPTTKGFHLVPVATPEEINQAMHTVVTNQNDGYLESLKTQCRNLYDVAFASPSSPSPSPTGTPTADGASGTTSFTSTNLQEAGVDEADLIKTDGQYVYAIAGNKLKITKVWPVNDFKSVGELVLTGTSSGMMLVDKAVIVFSSVIMPSASQTATSKTTLCPPQGCGSYGGTQVSIVDIKDPAHPQMIRETVYEGSLVSQRRIGNKVHMVTSRHLSLGTTQLQLKSVPYNEWPECNADGKLTDPKAWHAKLEDLKAQNHAIIAAADLSDQFPKSSSQATTRIYANPKAATLSVVSLVTLDMSALTQPDNIMMVMGGADTIYASHQSIYVADSSYSYEKDSTIIHRFSLEGRSDYAGSTEVGGHLINSFAMGEYNGVLRVATTTGQVFGSSDSTISSTVYTLDATAQDLPQLGKIEGIGKGETIYSVRFVGPRGFVVTFKKIDPLFVLNLRDPKNPSVMGELKVPGFSTYLHPLDDNHLIGLGKDAQDMGNFAWFQGLKLAIFDVTDSTAPAESQSLIVGGRGSDSEALEDHHAFTFDASRQLLAIPVTLYAKSDAGGSGVGAFQYAGLHLYRVTVEKGFELVGVVKSSTDKKGYGYSLNDIRRSILIGDDKQSALITMQKNGLMLHKLDDQLTPLGSVSWADVTFAQQGILF